MDLLTRHRLLPMRLLNTRCLLQTRLNNHRDYTTRSVMAVSFLPHLLHNLLINIVVILIGVDVIHEPNNMDVPSPRLLWLLVLTVQRVNMSMA